jgi:single-strand DNA-binding protein
VLRNFNASLTMLDGRNEGAGGGDRSIDQDRAPARGAGPKGKGGKGAPEDFSRGADFDDEIPF